MQMGTMETQIKELFVLLLFVIKVLFVLTKIFLNAYKGLVGSTPTLTTVT